MKADGVGFSFEWSLVKRSVLLFVRLFLMILRHLLIDFDHVLSGVEKKVRFDDNKKAMS